MSDTTTLPAEFVHEVTPTDPTNPLIAGVRINGQVPPWRVVGRPRLEQHPDPSIEWFCPVLWVRFLTSCVEFHQQADDPRPLVLLDGQRVPWTMPTLDVLMPAVTQEDDDLHLELTADHKSLGWSSPLTVDVPLLCAPQEGPADQEWVHWFLAAVWPLTEDGSQGAMVPIPEPRTSVSFGPSYLLHLPPGLLDNELARRAVIDAGRREARHHGYHGRVRFFRVMPTQRQFIENRPGNVFMAVDR